jgi:autotransporter-associated beta strand protein
MSQATNLGYRVDFIPIHWYKCGQSATQLSNYLASVHQVTGLPIWLTEFNYGANWCDVNGSLPPTPSQEATAVTQFLNVLENAPFVERYSIYNWVTTNREMVLDNGTLTPAGVIYVNRQSAMAYTQTLPPGGSRSIAQFQFETNTLDSSGYGNNGFAVGVPGYTTGHSGQAVALDGTNSFIRLPPTVASGSSFTFAAWVYWNGGGQWQRIFDFGNDTSHYLFLTPNSGSGTLRVAVKNGGSEQSFETTVLPAGQWTHVAVTLSSGSAKIYTNGVLAASSGSITIVPSNFNPNFNYLGKSQFPADPLFSGDLDEVQIADSAFTASQISALLTNSPPQFLTNFLAGGAATQSQVYSNTITGTATDPDPGDTLTYGKAGGPAWLTVSSAGILTGTPGAADGGTNHFTVRVSDAAGASAFAWLTIAVPVVNVSGIWSADASGDWSDTNRWSSGFVANGPGFTADFSAINITANRTVTLDSARSIGTLKFGDTSGSQSWTIASSGGSILTLDTGSFTQPAAVVANTATITASLAGTNGFAKSGPGTLILAANSYVSGTLNIDTGSTTSNEGAVRAAQPAALANATTIQIRNNNNGSSTLQLDGTAGGVSVPARVNVSCRGGSTATIQNLAGTNTLSGFIALDVGGSFFNIQSDAGQLVFAGANQYVGSLTGGRSYVFSGAGDHLVNGPIRNSTNGAPISLTKSGAGTLTLAGANTYGGTTTVSGGALLVNSSLGAGGLTLSGGTMLGGNGAISSAVTVPSGATLAPGATLADSRSATPSPCRPAAQRGWKSARRCRPTTSCA